MNANKKAQDTVLIVDDHLQILTSIEYILESYGLNVLIADNGKDAIDIAENQQPDIIILDIMMPDMDGYEACSILKENDKTKNIPVIFSTALSATVNKVKGFEVGAVDYITKPVDLTELYMRVKTHLTIQKLQTELRAEIIERKKTEKRLEESNKELQSFAYVVSHDLQEPLRMITNYLKLLEKRYTGKLGKDADDFIYFAVDGARRMKIFIKKLLDYSRVGSRKNEFEVIDCNYLLERVMFDLQVTIEDKNALVTKEDLPEVMGDYIQLNQLFQNLLSNAMKYTEGQSPEIYISAEKNDSMWLFSISDNGIGIAEENLKNIFKIFHRANPEAEFGGTGIGLAVCKKIVEHHQGKIWAESDQHKGTTFYFTLPAIN